MKNINRVIIVGNLTNDPVLEENRALFVVATGRQFVDSSGAQKEETIFHPCIAWAKLAEICGQILHKGSFVYIEGRINHNDEHPYEISINEIIKLRDQKI